MSSLRNAIPRKAHKERAQPESRKKFGLLEKHKDYVIRAKNYHTKQQTLQNLREKAAFRNPDEFYFKMVNTKIIGGVHRQQSEANKYTQDELMLMKTQDIAYIMQKLQSEKKKVEKLTGVLHSINNQPSNVHVYFAEDREEAKELPMKTLDSRKMPDFEDLPKNLKRKTAASYRELEARRSRVQQLEKLFMEMSMQKELQKNGRKRKLRDDEIVCPTTGPVYKWRPERKR